jgi:hypothetical protein
LAVAGMMYEYSSVTTAAIQTVEISELTEEILAKVTDSFNC